MTTPRRKKATPKRVTKAKRSSRKTLSPFKKRLAVGAAALVIIAGVSLTLIPNAWNNVKNAVGIGSPDLEVRVPPAAKPSPATTPTAISLLHGRVTKVDSGDAFTALITDGSTQRVRLLAVDAPDPDQIWGDKSYFALAALLNGKDVVIRFRGRDAYGRILGRVIADGTDVGLTQLANGDAWYVKSEAPQLTPQARKRYPAAEAAAKKNRIGLWADPKPISPWEFRKGTGASELKTFEEKSEVKQPDGFFGRLTSFFSGKS